MTVAGLAVTRMNTARTNMTATTQVQILHLLPVGKDDHHGHARCRDKCREGDHCGEKMRIAGMVAIEVSILGTFTEGTATLEDNHNYCRDIHQGCTSQEEV